MSDCGSRIGRHLADMVNLFDPEIIVVGGEAVQFGDALLDPIRKTMEEFAFFTKPELVADWVPSSWARGAADSRRRTFSTSNAHQVVDGLRRPRDLAGSHVEQGR
ncbi:hypothetical protein AJ87_38055 [Rhizobium yanglingense]|nr:hypothetical protein AJ87_38055 [Rhizobium yanglingense]